MEGFNPQKGLVVIGKNQSCKYGSKNAAIMFVSTLGLLVVIERSDDPFHIDPVSIPKRISGN